MTRPLPSRVSDYPGPDIVTTGSGTTTRSTMFIGCSTNAFYPRLGPVAALDEIAAIGFTHAELMLHHKHHYLPHVFREVKRAASESGLIVEAIHLKPDVHLVFDPDPIAIADGWAHFDLAIAGAYEIGARTIVWQGPMRDEYPVDQGFEPMLEAVRQIDDRCAQAGVRLALENTHTMLLSTVRDVMEIGPRLPRRVGYAFDPHHAARAGANPMLMLRQMRGRIFDVHLRDFDEDGVRTGNILPGEGTLPWAAILRAVRAAQFDGPLMLEAPLPVDAARGVAEVRSLLDPIIDQIATGVLDCGGEPPPGVLEGIRLFNEGLFYECHEEIEHEWHAEPGPIRDLYQGILQIGVAFHHASNGNLRGARLLLVDGLNKLERFRPDCLGIDTDRLWVESRAILDEIERRCDGRTIPPAVLVFPRIGLD